MASSHGRDLSPWLVADTCLFVSLCHFNSFTVRLISHTSASQIQLIVQRFSLFQKIYRDTEFIKKLMSLQSLNFRYIYMYIWHEGRTSHYPGDITLGTLPQREEGTTPWIDFNESSSTCQKKLLHPGNSHLVIIFFQLSWSAKEPSGLSGQQLSPVSLDLLSVSLAWSN